MVSVIIPCFNAERYLSDTLASVFSQTFKDYEVLLVDDGSSDFTAPLIKSLGPKVRSEFCSHRGASATRNWGTELAKGEFVQYLDADDLLSPDALEQRVKALGQNRADVAYSDWQRLEEGEDGNFRPGAVIQRRIEDINPDPQIALFTDFWAPPDLPPVTGPLITEFPGCLGFGFCVV
jgi:glycosyltransferase involved in cell wall biosynthesis